MIEIYRARWTIELFFKWVKQHLRFTKIWSTKPQGIWNKMFLAMFAYGLTLIMKLKTKPNKTTWEFFRLLQTYLYRRADSFIKILNRNKNKTSKGRQKAPPKPNPTPFFGTVALIKTERKKENINKKKRCKQKFKTAY